MKNPILILTVLALLFSCKKEEVNENNTNSEEQNNHTDSKDWLNASIEYGTVTDVDGNSYATVTIGSQVWMAENLRTTKYCNGDLIPNITNGNQWSNLNTGAWSYYENNSDNEIPYGKLYNWYTVDDPRGLCPCGWHVPSVEEWSVLFNHLGGMNNAPVLLRSTKTQYWLNPEILDATNQSGFSMLPSGHKNWSGSSSLKGSSLFLWSSNTSVHDSNAAMRYVVGPAGSIDSLGRLKTFGNSVRCIKD